MRVRGVEGRVRMCDFGGCAGRGCDDACNVFVDSTESVILTFPLLLHPNPNATSQISLIYGVNSRQSSLSEWAKKHCFRGRSLQLTPFGHQGMCGWAWRRLQAEPFEQGLEGRSGWVAVEEWEEGLEVDGVVHVVVCAEAVDEVVEAIFVFFVCLGVLEDIVDDDSTMQLIGSLAFRDCPTAVQLTGSAGAENFDPLLCEPSVAPTAAQPPSPHVLIAAVPVSTAQEVGAIADTVGPLRLATFFCTSVKPDNGNGFAHAPLALAVGPFAVGANSVCAGLDVTFLATSDHRWVFGFVLRGIAVVTSSGFATQVGVPSNTACFVCPQAPGAVASGCVEVAFDAPASAPIPSLVDAIDVSASLLPDFAPLFPDFPVLALLPSLTSPLPLPRPFNGTLSQKAGHKGHSFDIVAR
ncbi:uncharacterized protein EV422DRAFT_535629 [Fimicolochytrium jonesii]|uniref:uncharacterized protein n=1 Tax=Fimicolochytrium jonesii TaxID=1396493 RepID=UPI0022FF2D88|nr:uncharacterized protein EV422DRAFT_535629 [Fimicolochytrium jonesii]KAI8819229.1 hypothetical protein EV422DRAFT_535629 [Fimicolochytrium jonesii]